jgi:tetratricopeptide (TPR) repeat protein
MISAFLAAVVATTPPTPSASALEKRFAACVALVEADPVKAVAEAGTWQIQGGGVLARQCLGLAYAAQGRWLPAMTAFEQAAQSAESQRDGRAGNLWVQAGNAALAAGNADKARTAFDAALSGGSLKGAEAGEVHLDRARALVAIGDARAARADLDQAIKLVPADPLGWLLSATLARRSSDLARAQTDIQEALKRSPDDAAVAFEAGNVALLSGANDAARTAWTAAVKNAPASPAGKAAAEGLKQLGPLAGTPKLPRP